ncbi:uncharacterized protein METZ01_LOCUS403324, partial [marine metagenome]
MACIQNGSRFLFATKNDQKIAYHRRFLIVIEIYYFFFS